MSLSRRQFLMRVAQAGGYGATFATMQALGLLVEPSSAASTVDLPPNAGKGVKVVIVGGGIAGLVSAYEMKKAGFECIVLEARDRPGGRNWTIRSGTTVEFIDGFKQTARYSGKSSYFNAGPARLPSVHKTILGYCKELGVAVEPFVNTNRNSLLVNEKAFGGQPVEQRQVINDARGHIAELLAKTVQQGALDQDLTKDDRERLLQLLRSFGDLKQDLTYQGSSRAGVARLPGAGDITETPRSPLDMHSLLDAAFWDAVFFEEGFDQQALMLQPTGGMDRIPYAFASNLGGTIQYRAVVREIRKTTNGVRATYVQNGVEKSVAADYCICTIPANILKSIPNDFSPEVRKAIEDTRYSDFAHKIAWESKRFWETESNIYGGISRLSNGPIQIVMYPSGNLHDDLGIVVAGYGMFNIPAFNELQTTEAKLAASRAAVERLHPGHSKDLHSPVYVAWDKIPYNQGGWVTAAGDYYSGPYKAFLEPDGRIYFAGDYCSHLLTWQEGSALSAHRTIKMISEHHRAARA
jgi:monoamine oxidase